MTNIIEEQDFEIERSIQSLVDTFHRDALDAPVERAPNVRLWSDAPVYLIEGCTKGDEYRILAVWRDQELEVIMAYVDGSIRPRTYIRMGQEWEAV